MFNLFIKTIPFEKFKHKFSKKLREKLIDNLIYIELGEISLLRTSPTWASAKSLTDYSTQVFWSFGTSLRYDGHKMNNLFQFMALLPDKILYNVLNIDNSDGKFLTIDVVYNSKVICSFHKEFTMMKFMNRKIDVGMIKFNNDVKLRNMHNEIKRKDYFSSFHEKVLKRVISCNDCNRNVYYEK